MTPGAPSELTPEQLVGVAINAIATQSSFSGVLNDARRLGGVLERAGKGDLANALYRACLALGSVLGEITQLGVPEGAQLESLAALIDAAEPGDDGGPDLG